jgi:O-antigen biosynthesis protein
VILCSGILSFKRIIHIAEQIPKGIRIKIHALGTNSIVGSTSRNITGEFFSEESNIKLAMPLGRRNKDLSDFVISTFFLITFPFHLVMQKAPGRFFKNVWEVFMGRKSWVGYASLSTNLPYVKTGIISTTSIPFGLNILPAEHLKKIDQWYAKEYSTWKDVQLLIKGYKYLST